MPDRIRCSVGSAVISDLPRNIRPDAAFISPAIVFISVVLPAPLRPSTASPPVAGTSSDTSNKA